jgi:hypothetical protein
MNHCTKNRREEIQRYLLGFGRRYPSVSFEFRNPFRSSHGTIDQISSDQLTIDGFTKVVTYELVMVVE